MARSSAGQPTANGAEPTALSCSTPATVCPFTGLHRCRLQPQAQLKTALPILLCAKPALFGRLRRGQLHRVRPVAVAERLGVDLFEFDLARQDLSLPFVLLGDAVVKFRHHLAGEQFKALADM